MLYLGFLSVPAAWIIGGLIVSTIDMEKAELDIRSTLTKRQRWSGSDNGSDLEVARLPSKVQG